MPEEERRRSERARPVVNYAEDNFNYERWERRFDRLEEEADDPMDPEEEDVQFVEEVPPAFIQQFNNMQIMPQAEVPRVPRFLLGEFY